MADFITTQIKASKKVIDAIINQTPGDEWEGSVDFNCVVPTPDFVSQEEGRPEDAYAKGMVYWRDWNETNWGTKWNAFESFRKSDTSVYFCTAWAPPFPVIEALSEKFPDEKIVIRIAGETNRHFAAKYSYVSGVQYESEEDILHSGTPRKHRFAAKVRGHKFA